MNMTLGVTLVRHLDQDGITQSLELAHVQVSLEAREFTVVAVDAVLSLELGTVLVETVGQEERNIILRDVTGCSAQHDPLVLQGHFDKRLRPSSRPNDTLLVKYDERVLDVIVLGHVVV